MQDRLRGPSALLKIRVEGMHTEPLPDKCGCAMQLSAGKPEFHFVVSKTYSAHVFATVQALPELLVLTDIGDLKNTLGLYRIVPVFEGLVQFATQDGTKIDASMHKLPNEEVDFVQKHRHEDISKTVMLKGTFLRPQRAETLAAFAGQSAVQRRTVFLLCQCSFCPSAKE